ncbi:MAG: hypothetical protein ACFFAL_06435 [Promethearchaeota archaeon]
MIKIITKSTSTHTICPKTMAIIIKIMRIITAYNNGRSRRGQRPIVSGGVGGCVCGGMPLITIQSSLPSVYFRFLSDASKSTQTQAKESRN